MNRWDEKTIINELQIIVTHLGYFPTCKELIYSKRQDLVGAITRKGGINYYRKLMGFKLLYPKNYWNEKTIINELEIVINSIGHFPTQKELNNLKRSDLTNIITNIGGMNHYRKLMGYKCLNRDKNYWKNWDNIEKEIRTHFADMINAGIFPSRNHLRLVFPGIPDAISKFGGIEAVAKKMNCQTKQIKAPDGHLLNSRYELIFDLFLCQRGIPHDVNGLIHHSRKFRYDFKIDDMFVEIWGLTGGPNKKQYETVKKEKIYFYSKLGLNLVQIESNVFNKKLTDIYSELDKFNLSNIKSSPSAQAENICKNTGYWTYDNTLSKLQCFIEEIGRFPYYKDLFASGNLGLHAAICKHGGIYYFRNLLNMRKKHQIV